jgi:hypothetical protein
MGRNRVSSYLPMILALLVSACSTQTPTPPVGDAAAVVSPEEAHELAANATVVNVEPRIAGPEEPICRKEQVTGSHRTKTICQTQAQRRAVRAAAQEWYRSGGRVGEISQVPTVH